jgi:hypothetical protein
MNHTFKRGDKVRISPDMPNHTARFQHDGMTCFWTESKRFNGTRKIRAIVGDIIFVGDSDLFYCAEMLVKA